MVMHIRYASWFRLFSLLGIVTLWGMAFVSWMAYRVEGEPLGFWLVGPLLLVGAYWLGALVAAPQEVLFEKEQLTVRRWLGTKKISYEEITAVSQSYIFITLKTPVETIRLYKLFANDDAKLINAIDRHVPVAQQARAQRLTTQFPLVLQGNWLAPIVTCVGSCLFFAVTFGAIQFGILQPVEPGLFYRVMMGFFTLFSAAAGSLFLYLILWQYPRRTTFTGEAMTQQFLLRTHVQPMAGISDFSLTQETRTVRGVKRQLYGLVYHYQDGETFRWLPHEFDFPLNYFDAAAEALANEWLERLRLAYLSSLAETITTLASLNEAYQKWGACLGWQLGELCTEAQHDGTPHIELIAGQFHLVTTERGAELKRLIFADGASILERLFIDLAFGAGVVYESRNRIEGQDARRLIFAHQLEILQKLNPIWHKTAEKEIVATLNRHPYRDL